MTFPDETHRPMFALPVRGAVRAGGTWTLPALAAASAAFPILDAASVTVAR